MRLIERNQALVIRHESLRIVDGQEYDSQQTERKNFITSQY